MDLQRNKKDYSHKARFRSISKWTGRILAAVVIMLISTVAIVRTVNFVSNHIWTENGIDEGIYVTLGGQEQYLLIRGEDVGNPVMIWLHGGPSSPDAFVNYTFEKHLVEDYTIVNWDQRGCGRTYFRNADADPENATASFAQAQEDLDDLVNYICDRFDTESVILVGHSYGTMLGSRYTLAHPDKVSAYIGVGQVVSIEGDIYSYQHALEIAQSNGDDTTEMVAAYEQFMDDWSLLSLMELRSKTSKYHVAEKEANTIWLGISSPYMGIGDLCWFLKQAGNFEDYVALNKQLLDYIMTADVRDYGLEYDVPVGFISGACDWVTPVKYAEDYFNLIDAPQKQFYQLEGCGHSPQYDAPEEFCEILRGMLADY